MSPDPIITVLILCHAHLGSKSYSNADGDEVQEIFKGVNPAKFPKISAKKFKQQFVRRRRPSKQCLFLVSPKARVLSRLPKLSLGLSMLSLTFSTGNGNARKHMQKLCTSPEIKVVGRQLRHLKFTYQFVP